MASWQGFDTAEGPGMKPQRVMITVQLEIGNRSLVDQSDLLQLRDPSPVSKQSIASLSSHHECQG